MGSPCGLLINQGNEILFLLGHLPSPHSFHLAFSNSFSFFYSLAFSTVFIFPFSSLSYCSCNYCNRHHRKKNAISFSLTLLDIINPLCLSSPLLSPSFSLSPPPFPACQDPERRRHLARTDGAAHRQLRPRSWSGPGSPTLRRPGVYLYP